MCATRRLGSVEVATLDRRHFGVVQSALGPLTFLHRIAAASPPWVVPAPDRGMMLAALPVTGPGGALTTGRPIT
jgi:hypothetical protein